MLARDGRFAPYRRMAKERLSAQMRMASFQFDTSSDAARASSQKEYERLRAEYAACSEAMDKFASSQKWSDDDYAVMGFIMAQVESSRTSR
jgi:hypothetical protein